MRAQLNQIKKILFGIYKSRKWQEMLKFSFNARNGQKRQKAPKINTNTGAQIHVKLSKDL